MSKIDYRWRHCFAPKQSCPCLFQDRNSSSKNVSMLETIYEVRMAYLGVPDALGSTKPALTVDWMMYNKATVIDKIDVYMVGEGDVERLTQS
jgi:hypothetical protein